MQWAARITAVALEMVLPGVAGQWLDDRLGTSFFALMGFAVGVPAGVWHLLVMTKASTQKKQKSPRSSERPRPQ
jgi:hypothetical protein